MKTYSRKWDAVLLIPVCIWGVIFLLQEKVQLSNWHLFPALSIVIRFSVSALLILVILWFSKQVGALASKRCQIAGLLVGLCIGAMSFCQTMALYTTGAEATNVSFITSLNLVFVPFFAWFLQQQKIKKKHIIAMAVAIGGLTLLSWGSLSPFSSADAWAVGGALFLALDTVLISKFANDIPKLPFMFWQFTVASLAMVPLAIFMEKLTNLPGIDKYFVTAIVSLTVFGTAVAYYLQIVAQAHVPPIDTSIIFCLEPVITLLAVWIHRAKLPSGITLLGCLFIFSAALIVELKNKSADNA